LYNYVLRSGESQELHRLDLGVAGSACAWARDFSQGKGSVLKLDYSDGCATLNILKFLDLFSYHGRILCCINYISLRLLKQTRHPPSIYSCNPGYLGGGDQEDQGSRSAWAKVGEILYQ
jgi:hypothetical protein